MFIYIFALPVTPVALSLEVTNTAQAQELAELQQKLQGLNKMIASQTDLNQKLVSANSLQEAELAKLKAEVDTLTNNNIELQTRKTSLEALPAWLARHLLTPCATLLGGLHERPRRRNRAAAEGERGRHHGGRRGT